MKHILRAFSLTTLVSLASVCHAQTETKASNNYFKTASIPKYGVYILGGVAMPYTDVNTSAKAGLSFGAQGQIKATYFLDAALDIQMGKLSAGDSRANSSNRLMRFENKPFSAAAVARLSPLKFLNNIQHKTPLYYLSNLYVGTGIGLLKSKVEANRFVDPTFVYIGNYAGTDVFLPVEFGITAPVYEMKNKSSISVNLNYRVCFVMNDKIDGYTTPVVLNDKNDVFNVFTIGIGYRW